jgi:endoglucanase
MQRRHAVGALFGWGAGLAGLPEVAGAAPVPPVPQPPARPWPAWVHFKTRFISADGRVEDRDTARSHTVSEGQAYALFFALVANDRASFERVLRWTEDNLCKGDLSAHLPAWQWGQQDNGSWGVIDANPASDADLWLAYALGEAGRLWKERRYSALSSLVSARVLREETADLPGLGPTLLPGPKGFVLGNGRWRLNASYSPPQLLQWLSELPGQGADWKRVAESSLRLIIGSAPNGFAADWTVYDASQGFRPDEDGPEQARGGYNAIRVYLWAGTLHPDANGRPALLRALQPMARYVRDTGAPPESIDILRAQATRAGPPGFVAALLPFLQAQNDRATLQAQTALLRAQPLRDDAYYQQALSLFALGWMEGFYRYTAAGRLLPHWSAP